MVCFCGDGWFSVALSFFQYTICTPKIARLVECTNEIIAIGDKFFSRSLRLILPSLQRGSHNRYKAPPSHFEIMKRKELLTKSVELQVLDSLSEIKYLGCIEIPVYYEGGEIICLGAGR